MNASFQQHEPNYFQFAGEQFFVGGESSSLLAPLFLLFVLALMCGCNNQEVDDNSSKATDTEASPEKTDFKGKLFKKSEEELEQLYSKALVAWEVGPKYLSHTGRAEHAKAESPGEAPTLRWDFSSQNSWSYSHSMEASSELVGRGDPPSISPVQKVDSSQVMESSGNGTCTLIEKDIAVFDPKTKAWTKVPMDPSSLENTFGGFREDSTFQEQPVADQYSQLMYRMAFPLPRETLEVGQSSSFPIELTSQFTMNGTPDFRPCQGKAVITLEGYVTTENETCAKVICEYQIAPPEHTKLKHWIAIRGRSISLFGLKSRRFLESENASRLVQFFDFNGTVVVTDVYGTRKHRARELSEGDENDLPKPAKKVGPPGGIIVQLPENGVWSDYSVTVSSMDQPPITGSLRISSVGQETVEAEKCRWIEISSNHSLKINEEEIKSKEIHKGLIRENSFQRHFSSKPRWIRIWTQVQNSDPQLLSPRMFQNDQLKLNLILGMPLHDEKALPNKVISTPLGQFECEGVSGYILIRDGYSQTVDETRVVKDLRMEVKRFTHSIAPYGAVQWEVTLVLPDSTEDLTSHKEVYTLEKNGKGATSRLPDQN